MKQFKLMLSVAVFLLILAYTLAFSAHNSGSVGVDFLLGFQVAMPLALWLGLFFTAGALFAWLITGLANTAQKIKLKKLKKELEDAKRRLDKVS